MVRSRAVTGPIAFHRALLAAVFAAILVAVTLVAEGAATPPRRSSGPGPAAASNRALLDLYALESKLTRARAQLADASAKAEALAARQRRTHAQLRFAETTLKRVQITPHRTRYVIKFIEVPDESFRGVKTSRQRAGPTV